MRGAERGTWKNRSVAHKNLSKTNRKSTFFISKSLSFVRFLIGFYVAQEKWLAHLEKPKKNKRFRRSVSICVNKKPMKNHRKIHDFYVENH